MALVAFLGSRLGSHSRKLLRHKQMRMGVGEGQNRKRAGTTPVPLPLRLRLRWSFPPLWLRAQIRTTSPSDQCGISN